MARNGSGTYTNPYPNFVSGTVISSTEVDTNNSQIATALTQSIAVDGQSVVTADLPLATHKFTGMKVGTAATDSLSLGQAQAEAFVWCGTAGGSADAITLTPSPPITAYAAGQRFVWMASGVTNTTATTVAISGLGAIALQDNGAALTAGQHAAGKMFMGILNTTSTVQIMQVQVSGTDPLIVSSLTVTGDATIGDDLLLDSDAAVIKLGDNQDVTVTHVHDSGLTLKNTSTGDDTPFVLLVQTGETDIALNDALGKIQFQAPDEAEGTDAILVAAEIAAVSEGDFSASNNATKLSFKTAASEAATEKMSLSSAGDLTVSGDVITGDDVILDNDGGVVYFGDNQDVFLSHIHDSGLTFKNTSTGDDTPVLLLMQTGETDIAANDVLGKIQFQAPDEAEGTDAILVAAEIAAVSEGDFSATSNATKLSFKTGASEAATEKMSLSSGGNLTVSGNIDVDGTANLDAVDIDGAVQIDSTVTVGEDDTGYDVKFFGDTASAFMLWDTSTDDLVLAGAAGLVIPDGGTIGSASDTDALTINSTGDCTHEGHVLAAADSTYDLGENATRWRQAYIDEIDVGSNTSLAASASNAMFVGYAGGGSEYAIEVKTDASTGVAMYFLHSTTTACGSISVGSSATAYNTSSDYRLKENVSDMSGAITRLKNLKPKRFNWISDENNELLDGFLAHEVDAVVPQAIHGGKDATKDGEPVYQGIDQSKLVPLLTGALQEAIAKIETLETKVAALES